MWMENTGKVIKPAEPHSLPASPHQVRDPTPTDRCCNAAAQLRAPALVKQWRYTLWKKSSFPLILLWERVFSHSHLTQNLSSFLLGCNWGGWKKLSFYFFTLPNPGRSPTLRILVLLEQWRLFKRNILIVLILLEFPSGAGFDHLIPQWLDHFTWLFLLMALEEWLQYQPPHPAALWP